MIDLIGKKFGRLTVLSVANKTKYGYKWNCVCDCGNKVVVLGTNLRKQNTMSCGCYQKDRARETQLKHGDSKRHNTNRLYRCWCDMKTRTQNPNSACAKSYNKRGIKCCDEWANSYESFKMWAINNGYNDNLTLDRINVDDGYYPKNCRWITIKEQARNKRNTVYYKNTPVSKLSEDFGLNYHTIMSAVYRGQGRGLNKNQILKKYFNI